MLGEQAEHGVNIMNILELTDKRNEVLQRLEYLDDSTSFFNETFEISIDHPEKMPAIVKAWEIERQDLADELAYLDFQIQSSTEA